MAGTYGRPAPDLKTELLERGPSFSFFQALRLLRRLTADDDGEVPGLRADHVRIRPHLSLGFPAAGIASITESEPGCFTVSPNLMGLYGSASPLPTFYSEDLLDEASDGGRTLRDLFDVINHRIYELLFDAWTKYRSMLTLIENRDRSAMDRFFSLIGMTPETLGAVFPQPEALLRYTGLLAMKTRSAAGLEALIGDALGGIPVRVIQGIEQEGRIPDDQLARLGETLKLGRTSTLGRTVTSRNGAIRIELGPLSDRDYHRLIPGGTDHDILSALITLYLNQPLSWDLELIRNAVSAPTTLCLGGDTCSRLGLDTWLFSETGPDEFRTRFTPTGKAA
ncbi:type VI secretion system baseplate subunit TssG [Desulfatiferula olefinivorans]